MEEAFKEFEAKDLDGAIQQACEFFDTDRARLEIEILQDAKSGIFGIVGVRKAKIRAKRVHVRETVESILGRDGDKKGKSREQGEQRQPPKAVTPENGSQGDNSAHRPERRRGKPARAAAQGSARQQPQTPQTPVANTPVQQDELRTFGANDADEVDAEGWSHPHTPLESLDRDTLIATVEEATRQIIRPIAGTPSLLEVIVGDNRVHVRLDCGDDSGLLIGREGITLAALQYILSRVVSCRMNVSVRIQLDAGDYRRHQEDKLREMAHGLAERVRQTGRSFSTRPLSSYHRRIVHLALQGMEDIQSRSSGDGALKRVVISRRRAERSERTSQ